MEQCSSHTPHEGDDAVLFVRYRAKGDVAAMDELVKRHSRMLARYLRGILKNPSDTEEALQNTWIHIMKHAEKFSGDNFIAWLMRIARNIAIDHRRRRHLIRSHNTSLDAMECDDDRSLLSRLHDPTPTPLTLVESDDLLQRILQHITTLPEKFRDVFLLRVTSDLTFDHIAKLQGTPVSTVMTRMDTAVQKLRTALSAEGKNS